MLKTKDLRMTRQRKLILEALCGRKAHPTADEVYEAVRRRMPRVSLGTVYRNLEILSEAGVINRVPGTPMRFDGEIHPHYHIRCLQCGKVADMPTSGKIAIRRNIEAPAGWDLVGEQIEFVGRCPSCKAGGTTRRPGKISYQRKEEPEWRL